MKNNDVLKKSIREKAQRSDRESGLVSSHRSITSPLFLRLLPERDPGTPGPQDPDTGTGTSATPRMDSSLDD